MRYVPLIIAGFISLTTAAHTSSTETAPLKQRLAEKGENIINNNSNVSNNKLAQSTIMDKVVATSQAGTDLEGKNRVQDTVQAANAVKNLR